MRRFHSVLLSGALVAAGTAAWAALETSHHDLTTYASGNNQVCFPCHGRNDTNNATTMANNSGSVGALCLGRCHSGTGILATSDTLVPMHASYPAPSNATNAAANVTPTTPDYTRVYFTNSHGNDPTALTNPVDGSAVALAVTYPYTTGGVNMECSSCHSVHDNANTPFIWQPLGAAGGQHFCSSCHTERATVVNLTTQAPDGNHPVDFAIDSTAAAGRNTMGRLPRRIAIDSDPGRYFDVASSNGAALNNTGTAYTMGGKLNNFANWTGAGSTQEMGCYTCHSAHHTQWNNLIVSPDTTMSVAIGASGQNAICMGCHGGSTTWADNYSYTNAGAWSDVGMTNFGHAVNGASTNTGTALQYVTSVGNFTFVIADPTGLNTDPSGVSNLGPSGEVKCLSCHDVHGGTGKLVARGMGTPMCIGCHNGADLPDVADASGGGAGEGANAHHRTSTNNFSANRAGSTDTDVLVMANPTWANVDGFGILSDGLQCHDCHIGNKTAHNW